MDCPPGLFTREPLSCSSACLLLATLTLLAVPPAGHDKTDDDARATLRQVATMTPPQQQAWLRQLKARLDWANRLTLSPEEAARQNARVTDLLQQKQVSFQTALELVRQRNLREKDAVEHLVQKYRGQVYQTFQGEGPAFTERQEAWYRVWGLWQSAGSPADQQDRLMTWLETAIRNSMPGKVSPLPADPTFTPREPAAGQAGKKPLSAKLVETVKTSEELSKKSGKTAKKSEEPSKISGKAAKKSEEPSKASGKNAKKPEKPGKKKPNEVLKTTEPATQPEQTIKEPAESVEQPEESVKQPAEPVKKPAEPVKQPAEPVKKRAESVKQPAEPVKKPAESAKKPADTAEKPAGAVKKPEETSKFWRPPAEDHRAQAATVVWHPVELPPRLSEPAWAVPEPARPSPSLAVSPSIVAAGDRGLLLPRPGAANVRPPSMLGETLAMDRYAVPSRPSPLDRDPLAMLPKLVPIPPAPVAPPPVAPPSTARQTATAAARPVSAAAVMPSVAAAARSVPPAAAAGAGGR